jgi:hypothetical protein
MLFVVDICKAKRKYCMLNGKKKQDKRVQNSETLKIKGDWENAVKKALTKMNPQIVKK